MSLPFSKRYAIRTFTSAHESFFLHYIRKKKKKDFRVFFCYIHENAFKYSIISYEYDQLKQVIRSLQMGLNSDNIIEVFNQMKRLNFVKLIEKMCQKKGSTYAGHQLEVGEKTKYSILQSLSFSIELLQPIFPFIPTPMMTFSNIVYEQYPQQSTRKFENRSKISSQLDAVFHEESEYVCGIQI